MAKPRSPSRRPTARPKRASTCRSKSATILRASRSSASARRAPCNCSTSAGGGAPSASFRPRPPTPTSRLLSSSYYIQRALSPFADLRLAQGESPADAVAHFLDERLPMLILADVGTVAGAAHDRLAQWVEDGGVLVRFAGPRLAAADRRRSRSGQTAARRPHPRRQPELGPAAAARGVLARRPVQRHAGAERRDRDPAGAGGARRDAQRQHLGDARRRHAAGDRRAARQGFDRTCSTSPAIRAGRTCRYRARSSKCSSASSISPAPATSPQTANAQASAVHEAVPPTRVLDGFGTFIAPPPTARPVPTEFLRQRHGRSPARLLRSAGKLLRRQHARRERSAQAARFHPARQCAP